MDIKLSCLQHPSFKPDFLQVENLEQNKKYQSLFYCSSCAEKDPNFKFSNYQLIQNIIDSKPDQIHTKWPPVNAAKILNYLTEIQNTVFENQQIVTYFTDLKKDIVQQIDICQKKMIEQAQELLQQKTKILNKYQEISKVQELKSILIDPKTKILQKEKQYRDLIKNIQSQKQSIVEQLASLANKYQQSIFNPESANLVKQAILKSISSINLIKNVKTDKPSSENQNSNPKKLDVQLIATNFKEGYSYQDISKNENNQYQLTINKERSSCLNTVSNIILSEESKYVFRIQIEMANDKNACYVGLMQDCNINNTPGLFDYMECCLLQKNKQIVQYHNCSVNGISKEIKGNQFRLSKENVIEMRVCLKEQILEVLDYPNYHYKLVIQDQYKSNLMDKKDLRLYLGMRHLNNKMILKDAFIVKQFE